MWEWSHGANRDFQGLAKDLKKFDFVLILLVVLNIAWGPDKDPGMRYEQFQAILKSVVDVMTPEQCVIFRAMCPRILEELGDRVPIDPEKGAEQSLWDYMKTTLPSNVLGKRAKMCQYLSWLSAARELLPRWTTELLKAELVTLETDALKGKAFMKLPVVSEKLVKENDLTCTTSTKITQLDAKLLRGACINNLVTQVALLSQIDYRRQLAHFVLFLEPLKIWQGQAIKVADNSQHTRDWIVEQMSDFFLEHQKASIRLLADPGTVRESGYMDFERFQEYDFEHYSTSLDDSFAQLAGDIAFGNAARRQRRLSFMCIDQLGRQFQMLCGADKAKAVANEFKLHHDAFVYWSGQAHQDKPLKAMLGSHPSHDTPVQQVLGAYEESGFKASDPLKELYNDKASMCNSSNIVELFNNVQKNSKQLKASMMFKKPARAWATSFASNVADGRLKFEVPAPNVPLSRKSAPLTNKVYGRDMDAPTIAVAGIASTSQKPPWFSPLASELGKPGSNSQVLVDAFLKKDQKLLDSAFLSCVADFRFHIVCKREGGPEAPFDWSYLLWHYKDSSAYKWPCALVPIPDKPGELEVVFDLEIKDLSRCSICSWKHIKAREFKWRGLAYQSKNFPEMYRSRSPALRAIISSPEMAMTLCVGKSGWLDFDLTTIRKVAKYLGKDIEDEPELFESLFLLTKKVFRQSDATTMEYLAPRLQFTPHCDSETVDIIMDIDEAMSCLMKDEQEVLKQTQAASKVSQSTLMDMHNAYRQKMARIKGAPAGGAKKPKAPRVHLPETMEMMSHEAVKRYFPETGVLVWKTRSPASWNLQTKGWPGAHSRSLAKRGETRALKLLVTEAWYEWSILQGKSFSDAPVGGLLPLEEVFFEAS